MAQFTVKTRKTEAPQEQIIEAETPEEAVEQIVVASEEAADGSSVEILQVTPGPGAEPKAEAEAPAEQPAEAPAEAPATA